ncbi:MAG: helix-turn-helix domain-containing protein [Anaerolineales bacterium]|nr:helix-turn-helix domain-containing protein [Anaerolineales bacterium]
MTDALYTIPEVARYLKLSRSKVYYLVQRGAMPHVRIGKNVRIREQQLRDWLELNSSGPSEHPALPVGQKRLSG